MRKRQLNWKLLLWLVGTAAVSTAVVRFAHSAQMKRHARTLLAQADQEEADGKLDREAEYLKRYLSFNGGDTDALARYGFALDRTATSDAARARAAAVFEKVLVRDRKRDKVRSRLIELCLELGRFTTKEAGWLAEARQQAEILIQTRPDDGEAHLLLGRCFEAEGEPNLARRSYEQAVKQDPHLLSASVHLARLLRRMEFADEGDEILAAMVRANDKEAAAYLERALYRLGSGALKEAGEDLAEAHKLDEKNARVLLALADLAQREGKVQDARKWWNKGVAAHGDDPVMLAGLATLELQQAQPAAARLLLEEALKRYPSDPELNYLFTESLLQQNRFDKAAEEIAQLRTRDGMTTLANFLSARLLMHQHRPLEAANELEETLRQSSLAPGLAALICLCLGEAYEQVGNGDRRLAAYRKAVELGPGLVRARVLFGAALLETGSAEAAVEQLSEATRLPLPPDEAWTLLARALLQHTQTLPVSRRTWDKVEAALDKAAVNASQKVPVALLRADELMARGREAEADAALAKASTELGVSKNVEQLWAARARVAARSGRFKRAAEVLAEARAKLGESVELRLATIECWPGAEGANALAFLRDQEARLERFITPTDRARVETALAAAHYRIGNTADSNRLCRRLLNWLNDSSRQSEFDDWVRLLDLAMPGGDDRLISEIISELKKREDNDGAWWRYASAAHQVVKAFRGDRSGLEEARAALVKVTALRPGWGRAAVLQANLDYVTGDPVKALSGYLRAFDLGERQLEVVQRLVQLLLVRDRLADADEVMRKAQQQLIPRGEFARTGADIAIRVRNFERAVVLARLAVPEDTTDPAKVLWLGRVYADARQANQAETLFRAVIDRAWDEEKKVWRYDPLDAWLILVTHLARDNRPQEAEATIDQMRRQLPLEQQPYALGVCYEALGRMAKAEENFRAALERRKNEALLLQRLASLLIRLNRAKEAEPLLVKMLGPTVVAPEANMTWARRQLALLLADRGGDANYQGALSLLEENRKNSREAIADVRARAFVQATRPDGRLAALKTLEESRSTQRLDPDEQFRLARLYEGSEEEWPRVHDLMEELLKMDAMNPEYLAHHVASLLAHGERMEARPLVERLARLEGESARVKRYRAEVLKTMK